MKALKKLALVSAVSMISAGAFAMEAMDDESMSAATGQDGITILVSPGTKSAAQLIALGVAETAPASGILNTDALIDANNNNQFKGLSITQVRIHDDDGFTVAQGGSAATGNSGALVIGDGTAADSTVVFADDSSPIQIDIDMVGDVSAAANNQSMLNVKISTPTLVIKTGAMYVTNSDAAAAGIDKDGTSSPGSLEVDGTSTDAAVNLTKIGNGMEVVLGATTINIQLGSEVQTFGFGPITAMIAVDAVLTGGLSLNNVSTIDAGGLITGGEINIKSLKITDAGGANLTARVGVNVEDDLNQLAALSGSTYAGPAATEGGLVVSLAQLGTLAGGADISINNTKLGSATAQDLGDVQILGLQLAGTSLIIRGH